MADRIVMKFDVRELDKKSVITAGMCTEAYVAYVIIFKEGFTDFSKNP
jgi:hypothetical protein